MIHVEHSGPIEISRLCKVNGLEIQPFQLELLRQYASLLLQWNAKINLISRRDEANIWTRHLLHSLSLLFHVEFRKTARVLDLGTGGGMPGIPLAIMRPDLEFTLLDSIHKKVLAVEDIVFRLGVKNIGLVCGRAGELRLDSMHDVGYDIVVARAVAPVKELVKWASSLARNPVNLPGKDASHLSAFKKLTPKMPFLLAMKGGDIGDEISSARMRFKDKKITWTNLSIKGLRDQDSIDKKLIVVELL